MILFVIVVVVSLLSPGDRLTVCSPVVGFVSVSYHFGHSDHCTGTGIDAVLELSVGSLQMMVIQRALKKCYHLDALVLSQLSMGTERQTVMYDHAILANIQPAEGD